MLKPLGVMCKEVYNLTFKCSTKERRKEGREGGMEGGRAKCKQLLNPGIRYTSTHYTVFQLFGVFNFFHNKNLEKNSSPFFWMVMTLHQG